MKNALDVHIYLTAVTVSIISNILYICISAHKFVTFCLAVGGDFE